MTKKDKQTMNEEIKKATKAILEDLHDAGKRYGEDIGYAKDDILYEMRLNALTDAWAKIDQKLKEQYLQGIKDFQIAISMPISDYGDANFVLRMQDIKAQQFIDSLEK